MTTLKHSLSDLDRACAALQAENGRLKTEVVNLENAAKHEQKRVNALQQHWEDEKVTSCTQIHRITSLDNVGKSQFRSC